MRPRLVVTANVDHIVILAESGAFRKAYAGAAVRTLDGMPLVWLARLRGSPGARRVTGHDLLGHVLTRVPAPGTRIFLVCANRDVAERMHHRFVQTGLPGDAVVTEVPPFGFEADAAYGLALAERVRSHGTTLLVMGVGAPKSEIWIDRHAALVGAPLVLSVGEALSVASGLVPRAPLRMQRAGLEWLFRFALAPRRMFRRYFVRSWRFLLLAASDRNLGDAMPAPALLLGALDEPAALDASARAGE
ncbi:WecB/TagA/CpsF family glycosyltransferase [Methylobacterium sp. A54F]